MKKNIAMKWVKALRSGKYKQGRDRLRTENNKFCCLGVLCNLHAQAHPGFAARQRKVASYDGSHATVGPNVRGWAGLATSDGDFNRNEVEGLPRNWSTDSLIELNDVKLWNFERIATFIEKNWKAL